MAITLSLHNGRTIDDASSLLAAKFSGFDWSWYDGVQSDPDRIEPVDFAITIAMNSRATAGRMAAFLRQSAELEIVLKEVPKDVDLADMTDAKDWASVRSLFEIACSAIGTKMSVASKVLHRKRPRLIPILDSVLVNKHYWPALELVAGGPAVPAWYVPDWHESSAWKWDPSMYMRIMADEIRSNRSQLVKLRSDAAKNRAMGVPVEISDVRLVESVLYWALIG
jgi:hypothetical protein